MKLKGRTILLVLFTAAFVLTACASMGKEMPTVVSSAEVSAAQEAGEVSLKQPGVVVNMPFVVWDGGKR